MARKELRIGILGGSFDPIHTGHAELAAAATRSLKLDRLLLVPARIPPHKRGRRLASPSDRLQMARLAALYLRKRGLPVFADPVELKSRGVSYTVRTLRALRKRYGGRTRLFLILGADELALFPKWSHPGEILELATLAVAGRPGFPVARGICRARREIPTLKRPGAWIRISLRPMDISATCLRQRFFARRSSRRATKRGGFGRQTRIRRSRERGMVPMLSSVARYIRRHKLYC